MAGETAANGGGKKRSSGKRRLLIGVGIVLLVLLILVLLAPSLAGSIGRGPILNAVNKQIAGNVNIEKLQLRWFGGQRIEGLSVADAAGEPVLACEEISTEASLWGIAIARNLDLGVTKISALDVTLTPDAEGGYTLEQALAPVGEGGSGKDRSKPEDDEKDRGGAAKPNKALTSLSVDFQIQNARAMIHSPQAGPVEIDLREARLAIPSIQAPMELSLNGAARLDSMDGTFEGEGAIANLFAADGAITPNALQADMEFSFQQFPVAAIDRLAKADGKIRAALGDQLNLSLQSTAAGETMTGNLAVTTPNLNSQMDFALDAERLSLPGPATIEFTITPALLTQLTAGGNAQPLVLEQDAKVTLALNQLSLPAKGDNLEPAVIEARMTAEPVRISGDEALGDVSLSDFTADVRANPLSDGLTLSAAGVIAQNGQSNPLSVEATLSNLLDAAGQPDPQAMRAQIAAQLPDLPIGAIDRLAKAEGALLAALGSRLSLSVEAQSGPDAKSARLTAKSQTLDAMIDAALDDEGLSLVQPATIRYTVRQALIDQSFAEEGKAAPAQLTRDAPLTLTIQSLRLPASAFPRDDQPANLSDLSISAELTAEDIVWTSEATTGEMAVRGFQATAQSQRLADSVDIRASGQLAQGDATGDLNLEARAANLLDEAGQTQPDKAAVVAQAQLNNAPVATLDQLLQQQGKLLAALGPSLNAQVNADFQPGREENVATVSARSANLQADAPFTIGKELRLSAPASARFTLTPGLVTALVPEGQVALEEPANIAIEIADLAIPMGEQAAEGAIKILGNIKADPMRFKGNEDIGDFQINDLIASMETESLEQLKAGASFRMTQSDANGLIAQALGRQVDVRATASGKPPAGHKAGDMAVEATVASEKLNTALKGKATDRFTLSEAMQLAYTLTPEVARKLAPPKEGQPTLAAPARFAFVVDELTVPMKSDAADVLSVGASGTVDQLELDAGAEVGRVSARNIALNLSMDGEANEARVKLDAETRMPGQDQAGSLSLNATAQNVITSPEGPPVAVEADAGLERFPVAFLDGLAGGDGLFNELLGADLSLTANLSTRMTEPASGQATIHAKSPRMALDGDLDIGEAITVDEALTGRLELTPQAFSALMARAKPADTNAPAPKWTQIGLSAPATFDLAVSRLRVPLAEKGEDTQAPGVADILLNARIDSPSVRLFDTASRQTVALDELNLTLAIQGPGQPLEVALNSKTTMTEAAAADPTRAPVAQSGQMKLQYSTPLNVDSEGKLQLLADETNAVADISGLPIGWIDTFLGMNGQLTALLGDTLALGASLGGESGALGSLQAQMQSAVSQAVVQARIQQGALRLREPLTAQFTVTPQMSGVMLKRVNPLLATAVRADAPIRIEVSDDGFALPLQPFNVATAQISRASLELGTIYLEQGDLLGGLLSLLKAKQEGLVSAKFSPLVAHLRDGVAEYDRMDITLAEKYQLSTWGKIDLVNSFVDMQLGIAPETLRDALDVKEVSGTEPVTIPMRGPVGAVKVDWGGAAQQILRQSAESKIREEIQKKAGDDVGGLLNQFLGGDRPTPAPDAQPAPDATPAPQSTPAEEEKKEEERKPNVNDLINIFR